MPWNCSSNTGGNVGDDTIPPKLLALPDDSIVCFYGNWFRWYVAKWPPDNNFGVWTAEGSGCPLQRLDTTPIGGGPDYTFGWLVQERAYIDAPWTVNQKANALQIGEGCVLPIGPETDTPETPIPLPELPPGLPQSTCDCLGGVLEKLGEILGALQSQIAVKQETACNVTDSCLSELVDAVVAKMQPPVKTCDECCQALYTGAVMSTEDAAVCSDCICEAAKNECSQASGMSDGSRCSQCDSEPCCCKSNICQPCEEEEKPKKYLGWCNSQNGAVVVTREGDRTPEPSQVWQFVSSGETDETVRMNALAWCAEVSKPKPTHPAPPPISLASFDACTIQSYSPDGAAQQYISSVYSELSPVYIEGIVRVANDNFWGQLGDLPIVAATIEASKFANTGPIISANEIAPYVGRIIGCPGKTFSQAYGALSAIGLINKWTGTDVSEFASPLFYGINSACRNKQLDPDKAIAGWLAGSIEELELDTHWAIAGYCESGLEAYKIAAHSKPVPMELAIMRRRSLISESEYDQQMRRVGYIHKKHRDDLFRITEQYPPYSDIIRLMIRDAFDPKIISTFGLNDSFEDKWAGKLRDWTAYQGIPREVMEALWRAHWTIPSPGELFTMYHRLRFRPEYGGPEKFLADVKLTLQQQDILPFWQDKLIAIAFRPLSRIDVRRAFNIGALEEKDVATAYQNLGYDDENVKRLVVFAGRLRDIAAVGDGSIKQWTKFAIDGNECRKRMLAKGFPADTVDFAMGESEATFANSHLAKAFVQGELPSHSLIFKLNTHGVSFASGEKIAEKLSFGVKKHWSIDKYKAGIIDRQTTEGLLLNYGVNLEHAISWMDSVIVALDTKGAAQCESSLKSRFLHGEFTQAEIIDKVVANGITRERAERLAKWWQCEQHAGGKTIPTATLCEWLERGAITQADFVDRLVRIGYEKADAVNLLVDCSAKINMRAMAKAKKKAEEEAHDAAKAAANAKKAQAQIDRERARIERQKALAATTRQRREKQVLSAGHKLSLRCNCELYEAVTAARNTINRLQDSYGLTLDESLIVALQASESPDSISIQDFADVADVFAIAAASVPRSNVDVGQLAQPKTNGRT